MVKHARRADADARSPGESASFLAGGEFPITDRRRPRHRHPSPSSFKPFGVALRFTPGSALRRPDQPARQDRGLRALDRRRDPTLPASRSPASRCAAPKSTLELPSGGSMVIGGLLRDNVRQAISGLPGLRQLPVLGTLFRSRDFQRNETELVIIVTPYLVKPVATSALARPDDGFSVPSDGASDFLGRLNRVYGVGASRPRRHLSRHLRLHLRMTGSSKRSARMTTSSSSPIGRANGQAGRQRSGSPWRWSGRRPVGLQRPCRSTSTSLSARFPRTIAPPIRSRSRKSIATIDVPVGLEHVSADQRRTRQTSSASPRNSTRAAVR